MEAWKDGKAQHSQPSPIIEAPRSSEATSQEGDRSQPQTSNLRESETTELPEDQVPVGSLPALSTFARNAPRRAVVSRSGHPLSGAGIVMSDKSRPQTSASRSSVTHVPSVTSHAFFRPMSSQRLQAQRGRPTTSEQTINSGESQRDSVSNIDGHSVTSEFTATRGLYDYETFPPSRGTDMASYDTRDQASLNPGGNTIRNNGERTRTLQESMELKSSNYGTHKNYAKPRSLSSPQSDYPRTELRYTAKNELGDHQHGSSDSLAAHPVEEKPDLTGEKYRGRNHQYFLGNTIFLFGGRLQNARDRPINILTFLLTVTPAVLFFVYSAPYYWHNISPAVPIIFGYIFFLCISSFLHASTSDPGILPRNLHPLPKGMQTDDPYALGPTLTDWTMIKSSPWATDAMDFPTKYCKSCNIWRPPRAHHCRICDNCIETQDHHCVWLNNCVGRRNYRYFITFVTTSTILGLFLAFASLAHILHFHSKQGISFGASIERLRVVFAMFVYGLCVTPYPASLLVYHLFLMGRGETTREYLNSHKFLKKDRYRPFDQHNLIRNWLTVLLRPRTPTYLQFKNRYMEGDTRFGTRRTRYSTPSESRGGGNSLELKSPSSFQGPSSRANIGSSAV